MKNIITITPLGGSMKKAITAVAILLFLVASGFSQQSSITVSGGIGYATGGDLNKTIKGVSNYRLDIDEASGELKPVNLGMNFNVEFMYHFNPNFGLGLGVGYFRGSKASGPSSYNIGIPDYLMLASDYSITPTISAIPITLNLHYFLRVGPKLSFDLYAGGGYYVTMLDFRSTEFASLTILDDSLSVTEDFTFNATKGGPGVQAGIGFEFEVAPKVAIVFNAFGRYASVSDFKGKYTFKDRGDLTADESGSDYTFWSYDETIDGKIYTQYDFYSEKTSGTDISNVKAATIDLTGFGAMLGIRFKF
jgi:hypothetical protein